MYEVRIKGFQKKEDAEHFIRWYEGAGEQHLSDYLESLQSGTDRKITTSLNTDIHKTYPLKWEENTLNMIIQSPSA